MIISAKYDYSCWLKWNFLLSHDHHSSKDIHFYIISKKRDKKINNIILYYLINNTLNLL